MSLLRLSDCLFIISASSLAWAANWEAFQSIESAQILIDIFLAKHHHHHHHNNKGGLLSRREPAARNLPYLFIWHGGHIKGPIIKSYIPMHEPQHTASERRAFGAEGNGRNIKPKAYYAFQHQPLWALRAFYNLLASRSRRMLYFNLEHAD